MSTPLLNEIRKFLAETGMSEGRFGFKACRNARLIDQLEGRETTINGKTRVPKGPGRVWPETEAKIRAFMIVEREKRAKAEAAA